MIRVEKTHLPVAALTHPGMKGKNNEDRFGVTAFRSRSLPNMPVLLAVLSDGIGGNRAGEVASELAVNMISQFAANSDGRNPQAILEAGIHFASGQIFQQAQENPEQNGMGATCVCAWIAGDRLYTASVGDSRVYLLRGDTIHQLSTDHTWIQEALERGLIQPDEAAGHPNAHVIRRYLGSPNPPEVDFRVRPLPVEKDRSQPAIAGQGMKLLPEDYVLLCSDGLTDLVNDEEILTAFHQSTLEEAGHHLVNLANQRGGHDNITIIAVQMPQAHAKEAPVAVPAVPNRMRALLTGCIGVIALAVLVGAVAGGYLLFGEEGQATPTATITQTMTITTTATRTPRPSRTPNASPSPVTPLPSRTPTLLPGVLPTVTAWPTNTPGLPIVSSTPVR
jgi:PPM family protein phosphatase